MAKTTRTRKPQSETIVAPVIPMKNDFKLSGDGTLYLLQPVTPDAERWCDKHLPSDSQMIGSAFAVEHRYIGEIVQSLKTDGYSLRRT